ncbi:MAG: ABC transporter permease [Acidimicrobiales bacterium]
MIWVQYGIFGLGVGAVFALLAAGIVLTYRASGVLNFAHASTGVAAAFVNFELLERFPWMPVAVALLISVAFGALLGVASHRFVFAPVANSSQIVKLLVSFGLSGAIQGALGVVFSSLGNPGGAVRGHTLLPIERGITLAGASVPYQRVAVILVGLGVALGLALLVQRTEFGIQLRALAQNPVAARLAGLDTRRIEAITWALAGASAAVAAVLIVPFGPLNPLALNGFQLKALAAALLGGFVSLPAALLGGIGLGVLQELLLGAPAPLNGLRGVIAPTAVLVLLLLRVERFFVTEQEARAVQGDERLFNAGVRRPLLGSGKAWLLGAAVAALAVLPMSGFWAFVSTRAVLIALLGLSVTVLTGWTGQVSLMPGTFAGVGACLAWVLDTKLGFDFVLVVPLAALAAVPACAVVGLAALRLRPLYLAVGTVALAGFFDETLFRQAWFANSGKQMLVDRPDYIGGDHAFAVAVIAIVGGVFAFTATFGRSRTGRALSMVRDNPTAGEASGVNQLKYRLLAFSLSAAYGGLMGALLAYLLGAFTTATFSLLILSLTAFSVAAVGGIRSPLGAIVGAFLFVEATELFRTSGAISDWTTLLVGVGLVLVMSYSPDGLVGVGQKTVGRLRRTNAEVELVDVG